MKTKQPKKIAILGGGMASLAAAYELTDYEGWEQDYEITLYQLGWRLGGKTHTGRGVNNRIEEHGIHILQGWYATTFRMMRAVFEERKSKGLAPQSPLQELFKDGLTRNNTTLLTQFDKKEGKWTNWPLIFPETNELPGSNKPPELWELIKKGIAITLEIFLGSPYSNNTNPIAKWILDHFFPSNGAQPSTGCLGRFIGRSVDKLEHSDALPKAYQVLLKAFGHAHVDHNAIDNHHEHHSQILDWLGHFIKEIESDVEGVLEKDIHVKRLLLVIHFGYYLLKGILEDVYNPDTNEFDFHKISKYDFREWLAKQGAKPWVTQSVIVRFFYTGTFSNLVNNQGGAINASSATQFMLKSLGYEGSFVFQFNYGTGDTMVMPVYEVLKSRGVKFKFFQKVENIKYTNDNTIEQIEMGTQVDLKGTSYNPVIQIDKLSVWPAHPQYDQLNDAQAQKLQDENINLENPWSGWANVSSRTLVKGTDFDEVILGIPVGTLKTICAEIIDNKSAWKNMVTEIKTTPTQAAQLWFLPSLKELGYIDEEWGMPKVNGRANVVVYQNPMYSWLDSSLVLKHENWPAEQQPKFLAYFTGPFVLNEPLADFTDTDYPTRQMQRLIDEFAQWLQNNSGFFWPKGTTIPYPQGMDLMLLADPENNEDGYKRLLNQFFQANISPTHQYTLSVPGNDQHRLKTDESGFDNLFLCGDWIDFGINVGYFDGAIQSGMQAAQALRHRNDLGDHKEIWQ